MASHAEQDHTPDRSMQPGKRGPGPGALVDERVVRARVHSPHLSGADVIIQAARLAVACGCMMRVPAATWVVADAQARSARVANLTSGVRAAVAPSYDGNEGRPVDIRRRRPR
jgi:hypothetical protein